MTEIIYVVDKKDKVIDKKPYKEVLDKKLIYRACHVLIFNSKKELLIQLRKKTKRIYPGYWEVSASGLVTFGESYEKTAHRELEEEMGIKGIKLKKLEKIYQETPYNREFFEIYTGNYEGLVNIQKEEVEDYKWLPIKEVLKLKKITPALKTSIQVYKRNINH